MIGYRFFIFYNLNNIDFKCISSIEVFYALLRLLHRDLSMYGKISLGHFAVKIAHIPIILNHSALVNQFTFSDSRNCVNLSIFLDGTIFLSANCGCLVRNSSNPLKSIIFHPFTFIASVGKLWLN